MLMEFEETLIESWRQLASDSPGNVMSGQNLAENASDTQWITFRNSLVVRRPHQRLVAAESAFGHQGNNGAIRHESPR